MIKYVVLVLVLAGGSYYLSRHASLDSSLQYVEQHKDASWAPRANFTIAFIYYEQEEYPKAQAAFTQLLTDYPTGQFTVRSLVYLETAAEYNHDWETAKTSLDRYLDEFSDGRDIALMRQRRELLRYNHGL